MVFSDRQKGLFFALSTVLMWATLALTLNLVNPHPFTATLLIGTIAPLCLFLFLWREKKLTTILEEFRKQPRYFIWCGILGLGIQQVLYVLAVAFTDIDQFVILFNTYPLFMVLFSAILYKERLSIKRVLFILLGAFGVYVLKSKGGLIGFDIDKGFLLTFGGVLSWALYSVLIKQHKFDDIPGNFLFQFFGLLFLLVLVPLGLIDTPFFQENFRLQVPTESEKLYPQLAGILYVAMVPTAVAFVTWNMALRLLPTAIGSNMALLIPLFSLTLISFVKGTPICWYHYVGMTLIIGSVALNLNSKG